MPAWIDIEEYEHGFSEALLEEQGFPCWIVHHGCYRLWNPDDIPDDAEVELEAAIRFLRENLVRLQELRKHLKNPMRLYIGCRDRARFEVPAELMQLAGALGMCLEFSAMYQ